MLFALPALLMSLDPWFAAQSAPACTRWQECQEMAQDAAAREDFETFHSLAWRAVQTGQPNDAALMFMLARAQALSGRPDDALVMLRRLADRGILHPEVETLGDFSRVREMAGWQGLLESMHGIAAATPPPAPAPPEPPATPAPVPPSPKPSASKSAPASKRPPAPPAKPAALAPAAPAASPASVPAEVSPTVVPIANAIPVPPTVGATVGLAYDRVSERLIIADDSSGTLKVLSDLTGNAADLVSRGWGGGYHTNALVIDAKRGDLWVVGTRTGEAPESIVHHLQLVSGRLLYSVPVPEDAGGSRFAAVALSSASVFVLDAEGGRIFELAGAARTLRLRATLTEPGLTGLTFVSDNLAYVAHAGGILRVDLAARKSESVKSSPGIALDGIEWIGYFENTLLAVQRRADGTMAAMRFRFDRRGNTLTGVDTFGAAAAKSATVMGDTFYFVSASPEGAAVARVDLRAASKGVGKK